MWCLNLFRSKARVAVFTDATSDTKAQEAIANPLVQVVPGEKGDGSMAVLRGKVDNIMSK
jgi:hypothetical protein